MIVSVFLCAGVVHAQIGGLVSKAAKAPKKPVTAPMRGISYYGGSRAAIMGADFHLALAEEAARVNVSASVGRAANRSWLTQQQRNFKAWQLKKEHAHAQKLHAQEMEELAAIETAKAAAPKLLPEYALVVEDFTAFIPQTNQQPKPDMPFVAEPGTIAYRGLALSADANAVRNILTNGLLLKDAGEENSTLRIAYASHGGYSAVKHFLENPVTNITYGPHSAASWGAKRMEAALPILTVVKIRGTFTGSSMEVVTEDIPASQIEEVIVRLDLGGTLTWCKVELNEDNSLTLTPYQVQVSPPEP